MNAPVNPAKIKPVCTCTHYTVLSPAFPMKEELSCGWQAIVPTAGNKDDHKQCRFFYLPWWWNKACQKSFQEVLLSEMAVDRSEDLPCVFWHRRSIGLERNSYETLVLVSPNLDGIFKDMRPSFPESFQMPLSCCKNHRPTNHQRRSLWEHGAFCLGSL